MRPNTYNPDCDFDPDQRDLDASIEERNKTEPDATEPDAEYGDGEMSHLSDRNVPNDLNGTVQGKMIVFTISELSGLIEAEIERQTPAIIERFVEEVEKESRRMYLSDKMDGETHGEYTQLAMQTVKARRSGGGEK